jgi:hypothetical protein
MVIRYGVVSFLPAHLPVHFPVPPGEPAAVGDVVPLFWPEHAAVNEVVPLFGPEPSADIEVVALFWQEPIAVVDVVPLFGPEPAPLSESMPFFELGTSYKAVPSLVQLHAHGPALSPGLSPERKTCAI